MEERRANSPPPLPPKEAPPLPPPLPPQPDQVVIRKDYNPKGMLKIFLMQNFCYCRYFMINHSL